MRVCVIVVTLVPIVLVADVLGSISAEHGIGQLKRDKLHYSKSTQSIEVMKQFKSVLDPSGLLNPYKLLP
eukprot:m.234701 g.234701  ORF g.234701 m.234701 type:complete len:70 (+) comp54307_c0_seq7:678-887(+)